MRPVPQVAVDFVSAHEGCKLTAYADVGGVMTCGYGHTGVEVKPGLTISQAFADGYLREDLGIAAMRLARVVDDPTILKLSDHQYAALLSFVFNVGCAPGWHIWQTLNAQSFDAVPAQLQRFIYAGGKVIPGLVNRRAAEVALWNTPDGEWPAPVQTLSSPVTRDAVQPLAVSANSGWVSRIWNRFAA